MKIHGSVALVTGESRGLGRALVAALVEAGAAKVYAAARDATKLTTSPRVVPLELDTRRPEQVAAAVRNAPDVTLLVNNAGVATAQNVLTTTQAAIDTDFGTNVYGTLAVIKAFLPVLEQASGGATVVNVLSLAALGSFPALGGYSASKAAAYSITQALRAELKARHIAVLAALPGPIDTEMVKDLTLPKTSPADAARGVLAGIERGDEEIFPDPLAEQMSVVWNRSHKEFERAFASF
ncbi:MAG TPA: SDR family NAD(P)-dependent oxidoreductase [Polyangiaceae bacterium]|nr:SDR family NAD(P)-dependent oxidoreductase [Polyangiaceae bacterium]